MTGSVDDALHRLDATLARLETALARRLDAERRRSDLEIELELMQDDRSRLALELDGTTARLARVQAANEDVGARLARAIRTVEGLVASAPAEA